MTSVRLNISCIYKIQSVVNPERVYIGSTVNVGKRWSEHKRTLKNNTHRSQQLQRHYNKYGIDDLVFSVIEECFKDNLIEREQCYLDELKPYFNTNKMANSQLGLVHTPEANEKNRLAHLGRPSWNKGLKYNLKQPRSEIHCYRISLAKKGHLVTQETREKISVANKGRELSQETRNKMSVANKGKVLSQEHRLKISESNKLTMELKKSLGVSIAR